MKNADEQLMTIFSAALDCETASAREALLDKACDDSPALRERVEALLRAHNRSVNFLKEPTSDPAITAAFTPTLLPGAATSSGQAFQEEFRQLLRSRLILVHLLLLGYVVMASALSWSAPPDNEGISHRPDHGMWWWFGEGGMGEVWLAEHGLLKRPCAVKFIRRELAANPSNAARFTREVQAVTALSHANTVRVYDYGQAEDGAFYFVMEYLEGPTLEDLIKTSGSLPASRVVHLLRQLCGALAEAHAAGLVHRDLKPGNVIVATLGGQQDMAKLLDFGLVHDSSADTDHRLTQLGMVLGTPAYMCPEQAAGESTVDVHGDIYSLGAVAFFALTGRPPFQAKTTGQLLAAHRSTPPPRLTDVCPEVPADLAEIIARCLSKDPADRFQSMMDVVRALGI